jgi:hypothetical protein
MMDNENIFERNLALVNKSMTEDGGVDHSRKESFYRRMEFHHFHVIKDQMACCCCVPLGMALHIIAGVDILFAILLVT